MAENNNKGNFGEPSGGAPNEPQKNGNGVSAASDKAGGQSQEGNPGAENSARPGERRSFSEVLENFWYYHKWHSIIALFLVFAVVISTLQLCRKENYDAYILYAGNYYIDRKSQDGNIPQYNTILQSLSRVCPDADEDGVKSVSLKDLFTLSSEEIKEIEEAGEYEVNYTLISENNQILNDTLMYSDYYLCFFSPSVYEKYKMVEGVPLFSALSEYVGEDSGSVVFYDKYAIKLSSLKFYSLPGIANMPDDTLICLKRVSPVSNQFDKKDAERNFGIAETVFKNIIDYK